MSFSVWAISLSVIISMSIHDVASGIISFIYMAKQYPIVDFHFSSCILHFYCSFSPSLYWSFTELRLSNILCRHNLNIIGFVKDANIQSTSLFLRGNSERKCEAEKFPCDCEWEPRVSKVLICAVEKILACGLFSVHMSSNHHMYMLTKVDLLPNVIL